MLNPDSNPGQGHRSTFFHAKHIKPVSGDLHADFNRTPPPDYWNQADKGRPAYFQLSIGFLGLKGGAKIPLPSRRPNIPNL